MNPLRLFLPMFTSRVTVAIPAILVLTATSISRANIIQWGGTDGEYTTPANWVGGVLPNTANGDTAQINSGDVIYTPGGDLAINNGGILQLTGGSWTQVDAIAWIQLGGGTLDVSGGVFNQGTSDNIVRNSTTAISVSGGTANFNGNLINHTSNLGTLSLTGGTINVQNEFKPIESFTMTAGALTANLISFADGPGSIFFSGGTLQVNGLAGFNGIYGGGDQSIDFTPGSTGTLFYENITLAEFTSSNHLTNGTIRYNGLIADTEFSVVESGGAVLVNVIPEPGTLALSLIALGGFFLFRRRS